MPDARSLMRHLPPFRWILLGALVIVGGAWVASAIAGSIANVDFDGLAHPYWVIFTFVVLDAVIPVFPSESLLNAAATLAAQDSSSIVLWRLIAAGAAGAIVGDSLLYWISRTFLRSFMADRVAQAQQNDKVAKAFDVLSGQAPQLLVFGRFVPGMRFVVGATMGLTRYPYPRFLLWDAIGGIAWAAFAVISSALVATVISDQPVLAMAVSIVVTTALLAFFYRSLKQGWQDEPAEADSAASSD